MMSFLRTTLAFAFLLAPVACDKQAADTIPPEQTAPAPAADVTAPAEPAEPAPAEPAAAPVSAPVPKLTPRPSGPVIPPPTTIRPELVPAVRATPTTSPRPAPAFVVAPPRQPPKTHRARLPRGWAVDLSGGTAVPIAVGVAAQLETPQRLLVALETGAMPGLYVDALHRIAGLGRTSAPANIVRAAARRALVVRAAVGVRPLRRRGLEIRGGYTLATLGGTELSPNDIDRLNADGADIEADRVLAQSTIHCLHADIGWRWVIRDHFLVRAALGYVQSLGARMVPVSDPSADVDERERLGAALALVADAGATAAIRTPTATLHVGYRF
jgi:hypothetical protein